MLGFDRYIIILNRRIQHAFLTFKNRGVFHMLIAAGPVRGELRAGGSGFGVFLIPAGIGIP
jgi:acyl CoA:acetate/3-ketoacid CoA transferase alpha subunit